VVTARSAPSLDRNRLLRTLAWVRLGAGAVVLVAAPFLPATLMPDRNTPLLALALLVVGLSSGALLLWPPLTRPGSAAWLICLLDTGLITSVVAATGGPRSIYAFLYVLSVIAASLLLSRTGALAIAASGSVLYMGLVAARTVFSVMGPLAPMPEATRLDVLTMVLNTGTLLVVAIVAGGLVERFHSAREELETQRKDLRDLQAFKDVILRSVGAGLIVLDRDHTVTALNRAAEEISGRRAADIIGRPLGDLFGAVPLGAIEASIAERPHASAQREVTLVRPDGGRAPVRITFSALRSAEGRRLGLIAVLDDLSTIREMEERMRRADRLATLGRLAANLAHEIRNPLASLTGAIEALAGAAGAREERERLSQIVLRESDRLNDMIKSFLDYARPTPLARETVNVSEIIEEVLLLLEHRELPPGLKTVRDFPSPLRWTVDPQRLRQALWNLVLNAVQAMPAGGELTVTVAADHRALKIAVADTGEGIAPGDLAHVFEPFYSTKPGGSGLGLALVHRIVQDHGGDIEVQNRPGQGTTFVVTLPGPGAAARESAHA
jgi:two-component system sensor histidine kinase PilS (NtrC family)